MSGGRLVTLYLPAKLLYQFRFYICDVLTEVIRPTLLISQNSGKFLSQIVNEFLVFDNIVHITHPIWSIHKSFTHWNGIANKEQGLFVCMADMIKTRAYIPCWEFQKMLYPYPLFFSPVPHIPHRYRPIEVFIFRRFDKAHHWPHFHIAPLSTTLKNKASQISIEEINALFYHILSKKSGFSAGLVPGVPLSHTGKRTCIPSVSLSHTGKRVCNIGVNDARRKALCFRLIHESHVGCDYRCLVPPSDVTDCSAITIYHNSLVNSIAKTGILSNLKRAS